MKNIAESKTSHKISLEGKDDLTAIKNNQSSLEKIKLSFCNKNDNKFSREKIILKRKKYIND